MLRSPSLLLPALLLLSPPALSASDPVPPYKIVRQIPLGAPDKWDFIHFDPEANRVWVSHGTEVTMIDPDAGTIVGHLTDLDTSHGILVALGRGFADSSNTKTVKGFASDTLGGIATLPVGEDSDAMAYDPATQRVFVMDADGSHLAQVTRLGGANFAPFFTPDGARIIFASNHDDPNGRRSPVVHLDPPALDGADLAAEERLVRGALHQLALDRHPVVHAEVQLQLGAGGGGVDVGGAHEGAVEERRERAREQRVAAGVHHRGP